MKIPFYHVDAFASAVFTGNPAGVCLLDDWLPDATLQSIAAENNLPETAFLVPRADGYEVRWFSPTSEVDLCGHATLGAAHVLFTERDRSGNAVRLRAQTGPLTVKRDGDVLTLDFPSRPARSCNAPEALIRGLGARPVEVLKARDFLAVFADEADVQGIRPDFAVLQTLDCLGVIATAAGSDCDFVSRFFAPSVGINEDPVTGSAHCTLIPYWSRRLGKTALLARQISPRGGELYCQHAGERTLIGGKAVLYSRGEIEIDEAALNS